MKQPHKTKEKHELAFWKDYLNKLPLDSNKDPHDNDWYEYFFTEFFGLSRSDYAGKKILDIGCGPMGSLEWASMAQERIGLDPLAEAYRDLVKHEHSMTYCSVPAEEMPFKSSYFDFISTFNSLDHVENVPRVINEIKRVAKPSATILLIVEINHEPSETEPHELKEDIVEQFAPEFKPVNKRLFGISDQYDLYGDLKKRLPYNPNKEGMLACQFTAVPAC